MMVRVDSALAEELEKSGGDYLTAYILAAMADEPRLIDPLRALFQDAGRDRRCRPLPEDRDTHTPLLGRPLDVGSAWFCPSSDRAAGEMRDALLAIAKTGT